MKAIVGDEIQDILLALNVAGWQTLLAGGQHFVVFIARHRRTGEMVPSQAPAIHALDAARWLAERCGLDRTGSTSRCTDA